MSRHPDGDRGVSTELPRRVITLYISSEFLFSYCMIALLPSIREALKAGWECLPRVHGVHVLCPLTARAEDVLYLWDRWIIYICTFYAKQTIILNFITSKYTNKLFKHCFCLL